MVQHADDLRTVGLADDVPGDAAASQTAGFESRLALERARRRFTGHEPSPVMVGRYRIVEKLGQGGMGIVYAAHDDELDRMVAVKVLRADLARDDGNRRRLLREAQAMARLSHPNVGHVYEVGRHAGQVYIAMERVVGPTLRTWCRQAGRAWQEIVRMHASAGDGLAAAHDAGLVHRDYKCENVLVGDDGRPRVLDFGLARSGIDAVTMPSSSGSSSVVSGSLTSAEITRTGTIVGTPAYMAPEQLAGDPVDARADQFSFCVALFECLYGERPFPGATVAELRTPTRPLTVDPRARGVPAGLHAAIVRGLAVDPDRRHASMPALLAALREHSSDPWPKRWLVAVALGCAGVAGVGVLGHAALERRAELACEEAGAEIDTVWGDAQREEVRASLLATGAASAGTTADRVLPMLDRSAESWRAARTDACLAVDVELTRTAALDAAAQWCLEERRLELDALVGELARADAKTVEHAIGAVASLSSVDPCAHEGALRRLPTPPADRTEAIAAVRASLHRASALERAGRGVDGLAVSEPALSDAKALAWPPLVAAALLQHGALLHAQGRYEEAERALEDAYFEARHAGVIEIEADAAMQLVSTVGAWLARHSEGRRWSRHAEAAIAELGEDGSLRTAENLSHRSLVLQGEGDYAQAKALLQQAVSILERELGPDHLFVAASVESLGHVLEALGEYAEAKVLYERSLAIWERVFGPDHPDVASALSDVASLHEDFGELDVARPLHERALAIYERTLGPTHPTVAGSLSDLAVLHQQLGHPDEARTLHERALRIREHALGPEHPDVAHSLFNLAGVHWMNGEKEEATRLYERSLALSEKALGPDHIDVARTRGSLGVVHWAIGDYARAQGLIESALGTLEASLGPDNVDVAKMLANLGGVLWARRALPESRAAYERAVGIYERALGTSSAELAQPLHGLGRIAVAEGRMAEAVDLAQRALAISEQAGVASTDVEADRFLLARALADTDPVHARELALQAHEVLRSAGDDRTDEVETWLARH